MRPFPLLLAALALAILVGGCATKSLPYTGDIMVDGPNAIAHGPARDRVMWEYRVALAALRRGNFPEAKQQFDAAIRQLGGIYTTAEGAWKARNYFNTEAKKTFIGEPYERVMVYYYRGLLYWMDGEPDNARACFRSAQFQDADTEKHEYAADYVLLDYLDGLASVKLGGDGADEFNRAVKNARGSSQPPPYFKRANVLVFLEFGRGPRKIATGRYAEQLRFQEPISVVRSVNLRLGPQQFPLVPYDDLQWQATTRGGRVMDHILANKAVFKDAMAGTALVAAVTSVGLANHNGGNGALIAGGVALVAGIISVTTTPEADLRAWDNLPRYLTFAALELPPGEHSLEVDFIEASGHVVVTRRVKFVVPSDSRKDTVLLVSELNT